jgi:hypothetical protein
MLSKSIAVFVIGLALSIGAAALSYLIFERFYFSAKLEGRGRHLDSGSAPTDPEALARV